MRLGRRFNDALLPLDASIRRIGCDEFERLLIENRYSHYRPTADLHPSTDAASGVIVLRSFAPSAIRWSRHRLLLDVRLVRSRIYDKCQRPHGNPLLHVSTFPRPYIRECSTSFGGASAGSRTRFGSQFRDTEPALTVLPVPLCWVVNHRYAKTILHFLLDASARAFYLRLKE